jgi:hypothetical protein
MAGLRTPLPMLRCRPYRRPAQLRADADRFSFIVSDLHRLLLAGLAGFPMSSGRESFSQDVSEFRVT